MELELSLLLPVHIPSHTNQIHTPPLYYSKNRFNIILPSTPLSCKWSSLQVSEPKFWTHLSLPPSALQAPLMPSTLADDDNNKCFFITIPLKCTNESTLKGGTLRLNSVRGSSLLQCRASSGISQFSSVPPGKCRYFTKRKSEAWSLYIIISD